MPLHPLIQRVIALGRYRDLHLKPIEEIRQYYQKKVPPFVNKIPFEDHCLSQGMIRIYTKSTMTSNIPLLIFLRGSGYCLGSINDADLFCYYLSRYLNCLIAVIEPPLSPEVKFPVPLETCMEGIYYLIQHAAYLKIDLKKVALWGESSGATFAASLSQSLLDQKIPLVKCQILFYPALDYSQDHNYPSKCSSDPICLMDVAFTKYFVNHYVRCSEDLYDCRVSPLLAERTRGLPQTILIGAQYDPLKDEGLAYLQKLEKNGVEIYSLFMPGLVHGFLQYTKKIKVARFAQWYAAKHLKYHVFA